LVDQNSEKNWQIFSTIPVAHLGFGKGIFIGWGFLAGLGIFGGLGDFWHP
jgi:hypothetical protein